MNYLFKGITFDDVSLKETDDLNDWSQICQECVDKHKINEKHLDLGSGNGICGVEGCSNESDHYIDFPEGELKTIKS